MLKKVDVLDIDIAEDTQLHALLPQVVEHFAVSFAETPTAYGSTGQFVTVREVPAVVTRYVVVDGRHRLAARNKLYEETKHDVHRYVDAFTVYL